MLRLGIAWLRLSLCCDLATDLSRSSEGPDGRERGADDAVSVVVVVVGWEGRGGGGVEGCWPVLLIAVLFGRKDLWRAPAATSLAALTRARSIHPFVPSLITF